MPRFIYMQSIVNYRIPVNEDGKLGNPEIESKWTTERGTPKKKKTKDIPLFKPQESEEVYM